MPKFILKFKLDKKPNRARPDVTVERSRITVGSRPIADVYLADRLVPQEAFDLVFDGRRVVLEVRTRLAGVFVNGSPVEGTGPVPHGATIQTGHALLEISVDEANQTCTVIAGEQYLTATVAAIAKKVNGTFALTEDGPQEERWGKSPVLATWNWIAVFAGILLLPGFFLFRDTEAVNRGALSSHHAVRAAGDATAADGSKHPTSCADCHTPFSSQYGSLCAKCHTDYDATTQHPYDRAADFSCQHCHPEHRGEDASLLPPTDLGEGGWPRTCLACHAGHDKAAKAASAAKDPAAKSKVKDRPGDPTDRWLLVDGFSHADHRIPQARRASLAGGAKPPEGDVPVPCVKCHVPHGGKSAGASPTADFALVAYETCLGCHAEWRVDVHGRDQDGVHCFQCHTKTDDVAKITREIRTTEVPASGSLYELVPRKHDYAKEDCRVCHVRDVTGTAPAAPKRQVFRHDHHLRTVDAAEIAKGGALALAATCVPCHQGVAESNSLSGLRTGLAAANHESCTECHTEGAPKPVPGTGTVKMTDMFHSVHTVEPGTSGGVLSRLAGRESLANGCLACHVPVAGEAKMGLVPGTQDCSACHKGHESLGGGRCALCHTDREAKENRDANGALLYRVNEAGIFDRAKGVVKRSTPVKAFDHFSPGHAKDAQEATGQGCAVCHDTTAIDATQRVRDVPWPGHADGACIECHVQTRYHR